MSADDWTPIESRYTSIVRRSFPSFELNTFVLDGMTTLESRDRIGEAVSKNPDITVYAFGVNDALPRGLTRNGRGSMIRFSYRVGMSKKFRHIYRTCFLNPLEYVMQILAGPKHYFSIPETISHIDTCINELQKSGSKIILINIAPVQNYRFIHAQSHIVRYNCAIQEYCAKQDIPVVDAFSILNGIGLDNALAIDKFHYSEAAHKEVAAELTKIIDKLKG